MRLRFLQVTALLLMTLVSWSAKATVVDWEATRFADHQMALRCYLPDEVHQVRAIIVLVPGMNGDGRSMANDPEWMGLAQRNGCALIGCSIKGIQGAVYHEVVQWSGELFLSGIGELARMSNHPELENVPLGFWGHSAGGQWNYNFACWKPERTFAFIVNKGAYYQGVSSQAVRAIPSLWIAGGKDTDERIGNIMRGETIGLHPNSVSRRCYLIKNIGCAMALGGKANFGLLHHRLGIGFRLRCQHTVKRHH